MVYCTSLFVGIKVCFTSKQYCILLFVMGGGIGMFNCLYVVMQELLCSTGYSNIFSGYMSALLICGGVIGATLAGFTILYAFASINV